MTGVRAIVVSAAFLAFGAGTMACSSDPPGDGLLVMHIDRAAAGALVSRVDFKLSQVAVFHAPPPQQGREPCTLCDLTGAVIPPLPETPVRLELTSTGDAFLGGFPVSPGPVAEIRLFVKDVLVTTTDGHTMPGDAAGFHGSIAPKVTCLGPADATTGRRPELSVLRLIPGPSEIIQIAADQTTTVVSQFDPNQKLTVMKSADVLEPGGAPLHLLKLRLESDFDLALLPNAEDREGLYMDQLTVVFKDGVSPLDVATVNAQIGATVAIPPVLGTAYRIKLPTAVDLEAGYNFYLGRPEVQGVLPAINYGQQDLLPNEGAQANQQASNLPAAWQAVQTAAGAVGSRRIRIGVIDGGIDVTHPDLFLNIAINQNEIPMALIPMLTDVDGDGLISFVDLNDPANAAVAPADANGNGYIDCQDLTSSATWADGVDGPDPSTLVDDLCGWDFRNNSRSVPSAEHGTMVAGIIGAIGNNGSGIAGANWIASIVPMSATSISNVSGANAFITDVSFISAAIYAEQEGIDIVNTSMGWQVASENANLSCADRKRQTTTGVPQSQFDNGNTTAQNAFRMPPWTDAMGNPTSRVLYVFSGGNSQLNLADPNIVHVPKEPLQAVIPQNVLIVGATRSSTQNSDYSCYGAPVVNIWAPGDAWRSLQPGGGTTTGDGTSFASPAVAGIAGLVLAADPTLVGNPAGLQSKLISRAATTVNVDVGCGVAETNRPWVDANASVMP